MQKKISKNVCLRTKFDLRLKKNEKFFGPNFQNYFNIWELYDKHFFHKKLEPQFFITGLFYKNQTSTEISLYQFSTIFRNCMKIV